MGPTSAIVLYAVIWFLTLFIVLPIRLKTQGDVGDIVPGTHAGAPYETNLKKKALITTLIAAVIWGIVAGIILTETITVRDLDWFNKMSQPDLS